jgi:hypothetical protein
MFTQTERPPFLPFHQNARILTCSKSHVYITTDPPVSSAKRIVYSTCSIHPEEDEQVVLSALKSPLAKTHSWGLAPRSAVLPTWERRGRPEEMDDDARESYISA